MRHINPPFPLSPLCRALAFAVLTSGVGPTIASATEAVRPMPHGSQEDARNDSSDANNSEVVIFQKNVIATCDAEAEEADLCLAPTVEVLPVPVNNQIIE